MSNPRDIQYVVTVSEMRPAGPWPVATITVNHGGECGFTGKADKAFGPLYAVLQKVVSLFVACNIVDAFKAASPIREQIKAAEEGRIS